MGRKEFMEQLAALLGDISPQERRKHWIITSGILMKQEMTCSRQSTIWEARRRWHRISKVD